MPAQWAAAEARLGGQLTSHLVRALWCGERLGYLGAPARQDPRAHPEHAVHWLIAYPHLLTAFRDAFREAFGMNVVVDAWGNNIQLRLSAGESQEDFAATSANGLPDPELVDRLAALQPIEAQSDGVRSFAGILLTLLASQYPLVLLDEPEAFLHPPQARLLGRSLAALQQGGQLFVATHSLDILLGLVASGPGRVLIVRLTRDEGRTSPRVLSPEQLAELWQDPLLRFSRALDGLFHDGVVVCEGDTDSQFYSAVSDEGVLAGGRHVMFTYAGGKQRIPLVAKALTALGVPVRAVVDFDALREEARVSQLVESVGGMMTEEMKADRRLVDAQLRGHEPRLTVGAARALIEEILGDDPDTEMTRAKGNSVRDALEPDVGWPAAKKSGLAAVPPGDATVSANRLLAALREVGVWVVPTGAVESFVKEVGGKGPRWVGEVVEGGHLARATEARAFVTDLMDSFPGGSTPA